MNHLFHPRRLSPHVKGIALQGAGRACILFQDVFNQVHQLLPGLDRNLRGIAEGGKAVRQNMDIVLNQAVSVEPR